MRMDTKLGMISAFTCADHILMRLAAPGCSPKDIDARLLAGLEHLYELIVREPSFQHKSAPEINHVIVSSFRLQLSERVDALQSLGPEFRQVHLERQVGHRLFQTPQSQGLIPLDINLDKNRKTVRLD